MENNLGNRWDGMKGIGGGGLIVCFFFFCCCCVVGYFMEVCQPNYTYPLDYPFFHKKYIEKLKRVWGRWGETVIHDGFFFSDRENKSEVDSAKTPLGRRHLTLRGAIEPLECCIKKGGGGECTAHYNI